jgi:hypothetical protein
MKNLSAGAIVIGLGILGVAASRALLPAAPAPKALKLARAAVVSGSTFATPQTPPGVPEIFPADVTQHHKRDSRDGVYLDPLFTQAAAANLTR